MRRAGRYTALLLIALTLAYGTVKALDYGGSPGSGGGGTTVADVTCTNQVFNSVSSGTLSCASVTNAMLSGSIAFAKLIGSDITAVGTIVTGVWNGTAIAAIYGGTGQTTYTVGDILYASTSTALSKLTAGALGDTLAGKGAGVAPAWANTALNTTIVSLRDEFTGGSTTSGAYGTLGWNTGAVTTCTSTGYQAGVYPHPGMIRQTTPATQGQGCVLKLDGNVFAQLGDMATNTGWDSVFVFRLNQTTDTRFRIGYSPGNLAVVQPNDGITLRYDTAAGIADTNYMFCVRTASASVCVDSTVAADTAWHTVRIRSVVAGSALFSMNTNGGAFGTEKSLCPAACDGTATISTTAMEPMMITVSDTTTLKTADIDLFGFVWTGLTR